MPAVQFMLLQLALFFVHQRLRRPCCDCDLKYICGGGCRVDRFKQLTRVENLFNITETPTRVCLDGNKDYYYNLMIKTNDRFYR